MRFIIYDKDGHTIVKQSKVLSHDQKKITNYIAKVLSQYANNDYEEIIEDAETDEIIAARDIQPLANARWLVYRQINYNQSYMKIGHAIHDIKNGFDRGVLDTKDELIIKLKGIL